MLVSSLRVTLGTMSSFWKVGVSAAILAMFGAFLLGRVAAEQTRLPEVTDPVTVGSTVAPTPSADAPTLQPRADRSPGDGPSAGPTAEATFDDDDDDGQGRGRGRGRGRGGDDDDVEEVGPSPSEIDDDDDFDDNGGEDGDDDNSGHGSDDSGDDDNSGSGSDDD